MCINKKLNEPIAVGDENLKCVNSFTYLGSVISKNGGLEEDIRNRLTKARTAFFKLRHISKSSFLRLRTKLHLYSSLVKSVLLYGSECWRITDSDLQKIQVFHNNCLRKILRIFYPKVITNEELYNRSRSEPIRNIIRRRRLKWLGHVLRMSTDRIPRVALFWTPQGKRNAGRPKLTWRRTVERDLREMELTWGQAEIVAKDRVEWRGRVDALCSTGSRR